LYNLEEMIRDKIDFINKSLEEIDISNVHPILRIPSKYIISSGGKRLRPIICTLCAELMGGDYKDTKNAFLALELLHNGTLIHDDIIDDDLFRRGNPSAPVKFGLKRAVLTGDALFSLGLKFAAKTGRQRVVELLSETSLKMVQGVALQTFKRRKMISEEEYLNINYLKSGSLFEAAAAIGGLIISSRKVDLERLAGFGRNFGNAYQIRDDIYGVFAESRNDNLSRNDLLNGDVTLPFIYALQSNIILDRDRKTITSVYMGETEKVDPTEVQRIYKKTGALDRSILKMKEFAEEGRKYLEPYERSEAKKVLNFMLDQYYVNFTPSTKLTVLV